MSLTSWPRAFSAWTQLSPTRSPPGRFSAIRRSTYRRRHRGVVEETARTAGHRGNAYQVQITRRDVNIYNFAMAHLRTLAGIESASPQQINPGGDELYPGRLPRASLRLASALRARGWVVERRGPWCGCVRPPAAAAASPAAAHPPAAAGASAAAQPPPSTNRPSA